MADPLSLDDVRHVATLARLRLPDEELEQYRAQLSTVLDHIAMLQSLDVDGVEPMARPTELTNLLADDEPGATLPVEALLENAPAVEDRYLAVPKVLDTGGGGG